MYFYGHHRKIDENAGEQYRGSPHSTALRNSARPTIFMSRTSWFVARKSGLVMSWGIEPNVRLEWMNRYCPNIALTLLDKYSMS